MANRNQFLVLRDVLQSAPNEKLWILPAPPKLETEEGPKDINLENVVLISVAQVTRIWPSLSTE